MGAGATDWIRFLFYGGVALAVIANIINFVTGDWRNWKRRGGVACGILAAISIAYAGHLANVRVAEVAERANEAAVKTNAAAGQASVLARSLSTLLGGGGLYDMADTVLCG